MSDKPARKRTTRTATKTTTTPSKPRASRSRTRKAPTAIAPSEDQIRDRAYFLYLERGAADGNHVEDWLRAEQELAGS